MVPFRRTAVVVNVMCLTYWIIAGSVCSGGGGDVMAFTPSPSMMASSSKQHPPRRPSSRQRRKLIGSIGTATATAVGSGNNIFSGLPFLGNNKKANAAELGGTKPLKKGGGGPTNEVVKVVNGMKHRRLGNSDIVVSELGLGTQRWMSSDYNAPDKGTFVVLYVVSCEIDKWHRVCARIVAPLTLEATAIHRRIPSSAHPSFSFHFLFFPFLAVSFLVLAFLCLLGYF